MPVSALALLIIAGLARTEWPAVAAGVLLLLLAAQFVRVARREARVRPVRDAMTWSLFLLLDKPPHAIGIARYWWARLRGRRTALIEYKDTAVAEREE